MYFFLILNFWLTDINIYLKNNETDQFLEKYFFDRKKVFKKLVFSSSGSVISRNGLDPDKNVKDPKHHGYGEEYNVEKMKTVSNIIFPEL